VLRKIVGIMHVGISLHLERVKQIACIAEMAAVATAL
jgi:hypothetical protein